MVSSEVLQCDCIPPYLGPSILDVCKGSAFILFMGLVETLIRNTCSISEICERIIPTTRPENEYDFVVIGAGSGGATVAGRLSQLSKWKVLVLEAGIDEPPATQVPMFVNFFKRNKDADWLYKTEPEPQACLGYKDRRCSWPRAKMLGGCSSINGMMHTRGTPADFDRWEAAGNEGWSYKDVLKWFKRFEDNLEIDSVADSDYHGSGGRVTISRFNNQPRLAWDVLRAAKEVGFPVVNDIDGESVTGFAIAQASNSNPSASAMVPLQDLQCGCTPTYLGPSLLDVCPGSAFLIFMTLVESTIRNTCKVSEICERVTPTVDPLEEYDFVVIGGGSGGAAVAGRLSEVANWKVLLLEAGIDEPPMVQVPMYVNLFSEDDHSDWHYKTEPETAACLGYKDQRCSWPRAKMLGGCSSSNGMMHTRGTQADFNNWAAAGNKGWSYEEVLPWFKVLEDNSQVGTLVDSTYHGTGGPFTVKRFNHQPELAWDILKAAEEVGYTVSNDVDGVNFTGFAIAQATNKDGVRLSSARAYLWPARDRPNLNVMLNSTATKIVVSDDGEKKTVTGVEFIYNNKTYNVKVNKEVILAAGAINSPQVLLLSGIGPKDVLDNVGIEQVHELPGVGANLTNHVSFTVMFDLNKEINTNILSFDSLMEYIENRDGPLSSTGMSQVTGRINSKYADPSGKDPDLQFFFRGLTQRCTQNSSKDAPQDPSHPDAKRTLGISPVNLHPKSRGYISLRSSDPLQAPIMVANYLTVDEDIDRLVEGIRVIQKLTNSDTLVSKYGIQIQNTTYGDCAELNEYDSDDYWKCALRHSTGPENHQASSCRMGPSSDKFAVVDNYLKVYGIDGLRIADASVMPTVVSGNTHPTIVMIAERAVDFIKSTWL